MRIVAGSRRGARIVAPKGVSVRPTSDRVRESLFALLGSVEGLHVLDLFAGSGSLGLEALSRGAVGATFVERDRAALAAIRENLGRLRLEGARVVRADAVRWLGASAGREEYDLLLIDPPYEMLKSVLPVLCTHVPALLASAGRAVLESSEREQPDIGLPLLTARRYGSTRISVFQLEERR